MKKHKTRYSLTIVFALLTFGILAVSVLLAAVLSYVLTRFGFLPIQTDLFPESLQLLIFMSVISVIVGTGLSMLAVRIPLAPINWLISQMNRLADGDFQARVHFKKPISMIPAFLEVEESFNKMAQELGYRTVFWSLAYVDWNNDSQPTAEQAFAKLLPRTHNGAVVLLHPTSKTNAEILDELLTKWKEQGYRFGTLDELFEAATSGGKM